MTIDTRETVPERTDESHEHDRPGAVSGRPETRTAASPGQGVLRPWVAFLGGAFTLAAGVALGWLVFTTPAADPPASPDAPAGAPVPQPASSDVDQMGEPVADAAESLLPSVVQIETAQGLGSGVIYDSDGLIVTAAHVVTGNESVGVRLSDGTQYEGEVIGGDVDSDIAVVDVDATDLPAAPLGDDEDVRVGDLAVAIGSPFGLEATVTSGVVSAVDQAVGAQSGAGPRFQSLIQTDAAINPGNSGGALANRAGEVIGINVSIFSTSGGNDGIGFAVPIGVASGLADSIVSGEPIETAQLGIVGRDATGDEAGAVIEEVQPGSSADEAGLESGDVVLSIDGVRVTGMGDLAAQVGSFRPGDEVTLDVLRDGERVESTVTLGSASESSASGGGQSPVPGGEAQLGILGGDATGDVSGAVVAQVRPGSAADDAGLQPGDVVVGIDGSEIGGIADLADQVGGYVPGDEVTLDVLRGGDQIQVQVTLGPSS